MVNEDKNDKKSYGACSRYIMTYQGSRQQFDKEYLKEFQSMRLCPRQYIELGEETIVLMDYSGSDIGQLEKTLSGYDKGDIFVERDQIVKTRSKIKDNL